MTDGVQCPDCKRVWQVQIVGAGEMLCPNCMTRIALDGSADVTAPITPNAAVDRPEPARQVLPAAAVSGTAAVAVKTVPAPDREIPYGQKVICPRCQLHFHPRERPEQPESARKTILVLDDLEYFRRIASDALEPTFNVKTAATSTQAREVLDAGGIDLIVLDLTLEGTDAGRRFLTGLERKSCPILIFTAQDEAEMYGESWEELQKLGADDLVMKGMQVAESLVRKARTLLGMDDEDTIG